MSKGTWFEVKILPRPEILDVQGRAVMKTLEQNGKPVKSCRVGKCIRLHISDENSKTAEEKANDIAKTILHNPLIETYELKVIFK